MNTQHKEFSFSSHTGVCQIYARAWIPENPKAVIQLHHGMAEHSERYAEFARYLNKNNYVVFIHDMANHGKSNQRIEDSEYFGDKNGWQALAEDMKEVYNIAKREFPGYDHFIFGHSMGSFIARYFLIKYVIDIHGAVLCGTGGKNPFAPLLTGTASLTGRLRGTKYRSKLIDSLVFGSYNNRFQKRTKFDWLSRNIHNVDRYLEDERCGRLFTCAAFGDLAQLLIRVNKKEWYDAVPEDLPVFLIAGEMDPVGNYAKGVREVYEGLKSRQKKVDIKLYENDRHEILNESDREVVFRDIVGWLDRICEEALGDSIPIGSGL